MDQFGDSAAVYQHGIMVVGVKYRGSTGVVVVMHTVVIVLQYHDGT